MPMPVSLTSIDQVGHAAGASAGSSIERPDGHLPPGGGELDGVLDQVPEGLLESDRVGVDVVPARERSTSSLKLARAESSRI